VAPKALHDSGHVVDPPKCHPGTRIEIIQTIIDWIAGSNEANREKLFTWLSGAAGAGKSAIGRSVCEQCKEEGRLLASFFFGASDSTRNHSRSFVATIAYQLCLISPGLRKAVCSAVEYDPIVFERSLQTQLKLLVMDPLLANYANEPQSAPRLIVVDGLDECLDHAHQRDILHALLYLATMSSIPIRVLVGSRRESHIVTIFSAIRMNITLFKILLDNDYSSMDDIELYLREQFQQIQETHIFKASIPSSWPSEDQLDQLKYKSSGQFIYATIVVRYVESSLHRPQQRLDAILGLRPPFKDLPFSELDALYLHLLNSNDDPSKAADILAFLALYDEINPADIDKMLSLESGDAEVCLSRMAAIVNIEIHFNHICVASLLHKSLGDFLFDSDRSKRLSKTYVETKAWHSLRIIEIFTGKRFIHQLCQPFFSFSLITENHELYPFIYPPFSLDLKKISYHSWSIPAQSAFLNAVTHFPMKSFCKQLFLPSVTDSRFINFLYNFYKLLFDLVRFFWPLTKLSDSPPYLAGTGAQCLTVVSSPYPCLLRLCFIGAERQIYRSLGK